MDINFKVLCLTGCMFLLLISSCGGCLYPDRGRRNSSRHLRDRTARHEVKDHRSSGEHTSLTDGRIEIKMKKRGGVYEIPVKVNGVEMTFIFDTGASMVSISKTEADFLFKQGKMSEDDIQGTNYFVDATGGISEGTIVVLRTIEIGGKVLKNVEASVVDNRVAPLLLGQTVLERFGKVFIDYKRGVLILE